MRRMPKLNVPTKKVLFSYEKQNYVLALCSKLEIIKQLQEVIKNADGSMSVIDIENWASERKSEIRGEIRKLKAQK